MAAVGIEDEVDEYAVDAPAEEVVYWANTQDAQELADKLKERIDKHYQVFATSTYASVLLKSWSYYHGQFFGPGDGWGGVKLFGKAGQIVGATIGHFRNFIQHSLNLATQTRPNLKTRSKTTEHDALEKAKLGDSVVDHYLREEKGEEYLLRAVEHALVLLQGFVFTPWNWDLGPVVGGDPETLTQIRGGDFDPSNPTIFDIVWDLGLRDWERRQWVCVRTWENKYDLAARVEDPDASQAILDLGYERDAEPMSQERLRHGILSGLTEENTDLVPVWHFIHVDSDACPGGRYFRMAGDSIPLMEPKANPYDEGKGIPLVRVTAGEVIFTCLGYGFSADLLGVQELLNQEVSTVATNHKATGFACVAVPHGWELEESHTDMGVWVARQKAAQATPGMPQGVQLTPTQKEFYDFYKLLVQAGEYLSGINSVARGQPEANLKSGEALKVMDSKAVQFSNRLTSSYLKAIEEWGTHILRHLRDATRGQPARVIAIVGKDQWTKLDEFQAEDLFGVDRIEAELANPLARTVSGRIAIAKELRDMGHLRTPEEYLTVLQTGQLRKAIEADDAELSKIHEENELLREGQPVDFDQALDYHALHAREHQVVLTAAASVRDLKLYMHVKAHLMQHLMALVDPGVQIMQAALGYRVPVPALPGAASGGGGPPGPGMQAPGEKAPGDVDTRQQGFEKAGAAA